mgnify:CR=1 FL=1
MTERMKLAAVIIAVAVITAAVLYGDEIGSWAADTFLSGTHFQIEQILE